MSEHDIAAARAALSGADRDGDRPALLFKGHSLWSIAGRAPHGWQSGWGLTRTASRPERSAADQTIRGEAVWLLVEPRPPPHTSRVTHQSPEVPGREYRPGRVPVPDPPPFLLSPQGAPPPPRRGSELRKALIYLSGGALTLLLVLCGIGTLAAALGGGHHSGHPAANQAATAVQSQTAHSAGTLTPGTATSSGTTTGGTSSPGPTATVETRTLTEIQRIPFAKKTINDPSLAKGTKRVKTRGADGIRTLTYEVTVVNGVQTSKRLVHSEVTKQPVAQVTLVGTRQSSRCDPNYTGACVPIASDVDCAGGSGDGPKYVTGPVKVVGKDIYRLDNDGDGIGCE